jgi:glucuronate isomerase
MRTARALLATPGYRVQPLLERMKVEVVCTTDDPTDDLRPPADARCGLEREGIAGLPPRPGLIHRAGTLCHYLERLGQSSGLGDTRATRALLEALQKRVDYFHEQGARYPTTA